MSISTFLATIAANVIFRAVRPRLWGYKAYVDILENLTYSTKRFVFHIPWGTREFTPLETM